MFDVRSMNAPPALTPATRPASPGQDKLVTGYLIAVAIRLAETNIPVRALRAEPDIVAGSITLDTSADPNTSAGHDAMWRVTRLGWEPDTGWSAILNRRDQHPAPNRDGSDPDAVVRYLPTRQVVPEPGAVAQFVAAVRADPDTIRASANPPHPMRADHRILVMHLARYVPPPR